MELRNILCCYRLSTLGITIGSINLFLWAIGIITFIVFLVKDNNIDNIENDEDPIVVKDNNKAHCVIIVICLIMALVSVLLITGIVKKRHHLILPWLVINSILLLINIYRGLDSFLNSNLGTIFLFLPSNLFGIGILRSIYKLYDDIRKKKSYRTLNV